MSKMEKRLREADRKFVWHPFTSMREWAEEESPIIERGEGVYLIDSEGRRYIDGGSSLWVTLHGHRHPALDGALRAQLDKIAHSTLLGLTNPPAALLAERLVAISPAPLARVFYSDNGSTAVEVALKIAFQYWQNRARREKRAALGKKKRFVSLENAYHGDTVGAVSVGGIDLFHEIFRPLLFESMSVPPGEPDVLRDLLASRADEIAAVIVEPVVQAAAGMLIQPEGYLRAVEKACREADVLLIADEVATGFGRTGTMFACEQEGVAPDLMAVAKGLSGGYLPLAATLVTEEVFKAFLDPYEARRALFHGHTYTGNPLACAVALANLEIFEKEQTLESLGPKIRRLAELLLPIGRLPHVGEIRQKGFMGGIELLLEKEPRKEYPYETRMGHRVILEARKRGVIIRPLGDVIVLMPPLSIPLKELERLVTVTREAISAATEP